MTKEISAKVPIEEYERFVKLTNGTYGATTWFIESALKAFNDRMEQHPTMQEHVEAAVADFLKDRREQAKA